MHDDVRKTMSRLVVHLNGRELYDVEPGTATFETPGDFEVVFQNHGQPVHVHLRPDDDLARVVDVAGTNHFVPAESALAVEVPVAAGSVGASGRLEFVTGYGKGSAAVGVAVRDEVEDRVPVDEDLGRRGADGVEDPAPTRPGARERDDEPSRVATLVARMVDRIRGTALGGHLAVPAPVAQAARSRATLALVVLAVLALALSGVAAATAPGVAVVGGIFAVLVGLALAGYLLAQ